MPPDFLPPDRLPLLLPACFRTCFLVLFLLVPRLLVLRVALLALFFARDVAVLFPGFLPAAFLVRLADFFVERFRAFVAAICIPFY